MGGGGVTRKKRMDGGIGRKVTGVSYDGCQTYKKKKKNQKKRKPRAAIGIHDAENTYAPAIKKKNKKKILPGEPYIHRNS